MTPAAGEFAPLVRYLLEESRRCLRPPVDRFRHPWLAPMPLSPVGEAYLRARAGLSSTTPAASLGRPGSGDGFTSGDYSLGLFHHDASESAIELLRHAPFREGAAGSLLCLLDTASPDGCVHRTELAYKSREYEPSKPVMAQYALRVVRALGADGMAWAERHRVRRRVAAFIRWLEHHSTGLHGLMLTHSSLQSGFDSDILTATLPDKSVEGPDTNAFMVLEYQALAELHRLAGEDAAAAECDEKALELRARMESLLWFEDERGGAYFALRWQHGVGSLEGEVVGARDSEGVLRPYESWVSLVPLYAGVPSPERAKRLVRRLLRHEGFWGPQGVRTAPAEDPFFHQAARVMLYDHKKSGRGPVSNWSGPVWVLPNYYLAAGLARYGYAAEARELALKTARLLSGDLASTGALHECYDDSGRGLWPRRGTFLSWNVLAITMLREFAPDALGTEA
jgi:putative isomerase